MKNVLWVDSVKAPPHDSEITYYWARSVYDAIDLLLRCEYPLKDYGHIEYVDVNYSAGEFATQGGDYTEFLHFLACSGRNYPVRIHAEDAEQANLLRKIVEDHNWFEIGRDCSVGNKQYIFHYDDSYPSAFDGDALQKYDGQVCSAEVHSHDKFDKVTVLFEDGFSTQVIAYELEAV